jgi:Bacterial capsule synthesis protein PGA_cap
VATSPAEPPPTALLILDAVRPSQGRPDQRRVRQLLGGTLGLFSIGGLLSLGLSPSEAAVNIGTARSIETSIETNVLVNGASPAEPPLPTRNHVSTPTTISPTTISAATISAATIGPTSTAVDTKRWNVFFGGDSLLTRRIPDGVSPFDGQRPRMDSASLSIINVETAITNSTTKQTKEFVFNSPPRFAQLMKDGGIDVGSLANNHSLDFGDQGLLDSIDSLTDAGIAAVGAGVNLRAAVKPSIHKVGALSIAVFGASEVIPAASWPATPNHIGVASLAKQGTDEATETLLAAIREAKKTNDVVLVMMHWGRERDTCPTDVQIRTGKLLRDAGATAVVGAHSHVLQPIVGDASGGVVAYSIGNFIWDPRSGLAADTGILELVFEETKLIDVVFHPHRLDARGWAAPVNDEGSKARIQRQVTKSCTGADGSAPWPRS